MSTTYFTYLVQIMHAFEEQWNNVMYIEAEEKI